MVIFLPDARAMAMSASSRVKSNWSLVGSMSAQVTYEVMPLIAGLPTSSAFSASLSRRVVSAKYPRGASTAVEGAGVGTGVGAGEGVDAGAAAPGGAEAPSPHE